MRTVVRNVHGRTIITEDMMKKENDENSGKKPYQRPVVARFELRTEEAVLGFCKSDAASGPSGGTCINVDVCRIQGS